MATVAAVRKNVNRRLPKNCERAGRKKLYISNRLIALEKVKFVLFPYMSSFLDIVTIFFEKSFAYAQRRVLSNLGKTAEERYLEFQQMYPSIIKRVPQYALASYLGMSAEFLSKIRKRLATKP